MRFVVDTNIVFSALYNLKSPAGKLLIIAIERKVSLVSPVYARAELVRVLKEKLEYTNNEITETLAALPIDWIEESIYAHMMDEAEKAISHEKDAPILACAMALKCDIISGDKHFHSLRKKVVKVWKLKSLWKAGLK